MALNLVLDFFTPDIQQDVYLKLVQQKTASFFRWRVEKLCTSSPLEEPCGRTKSKSHGNHHRAKTLLARGDWTFKWMEWFLIASAESTIYSIYTPEN